MTALCGQMSAPTPVAVQGVPLGSGSKGGAGLACGHSGVPPATQIPLQNVQKSELF